MSKLKDLTGKKFGRLTVMSRGPKNKRRQAYWWCMCECGNEVLINGGHLCSGHTKSCGCLRMEVASKLNFKDLTGKKFGRLTVKSRDLNNKGRHLQWRCKCECGNEALVLGNNLCSGRTKSCGCLRKEVASDIMKKVTTHQKGKNHPCWKPDKDCVTPENERIRHSNEYAKWRTKIFKRDNYICQKCEERGGKLCAHHVTPFATFPELRLSLKNGITFCKKCHINFHNKYGRNDFNAEDLAEWLNL